jgi:endonuclease YncB( thermonuclease family)
MSSVSKWDETAAAASLRSRQVWRIIAYLFLGATLISMIADHFRPLNRSGDDWRRFDGHQVQFVKAIDGQSLAVREENSDDLTIVALQGIRSSGAEWDQKSIDRLDALLEGKKLTLHLKPNDPRDSNGRLRADVFLDDHTLLSSELAAEGLALADRTSDCDFISAIGQSQAKAKKRHLGFWAQSR